MPDGEDRANRYGELLEMFTVPQLVTLIGIAGQMAVRSPEVISAGGLSDEKLATALMAEEAFDDWLAKTTADDDDDASLPFDPVFAAGEVAASTGEAVSAWRNWEGPESAARVRDAAREMIIAAGLTADSCGGPGGTARALRELSGSLQEALIYSGIKARAAGHADPGFLGSVDKITLLLQQGTGLIQEAAAGIPGREDGGGNEPREDSPAAGCTAVYHAATRAGIIQTADGMLVLPAGDGPGDLAAGDVMYLLDVASGRRTLPGAARYVPGGEPGQRASALHIPGPGPEHAPIVIASAAAAPADADGDPLGCLAAALGAASPGPAGGRPRGRPRNRGTGPGPATRTAGRPAGKHPK